MKVADLAELLSLPSLQDDLGGVEAVLHETLDVENEALAAPARRVVEGGGKRLRPVIALAAAAVGGAAVTDDVLRGAAAVELVHVGSLVHDDIMDSASTRRGVVTVNEQEGRNHAILVGDFLLARAGQLTSTISGPVSHALATAIVELCDGQSRETVDCYNPGRTRAAYERSIEGKTAALLRASCRIGALAAHLPTATVDALAAYGTAFGMAFQVIDDVLDLVSTPDAMGKPVGNDIKEGVYTLPVLLMVERDPSSLQDLLVPNLDQASIRRIVAKLENGEVLAESVSIAMAFSGDAAHALDGLDRSEVLDGLRALPSAYITWAMAEKAGGRTDLAPAR